MIESSNQGMPVHKQVSKHFLFQHETFQREYSILFSYETRKLYVYELKCLLQVYVMMIKKKTSKSGKHVFIIEILGKYLCVSFVCCWFGSDGESCVSDTLLR